MEISPRRLKLIENLHIPFWLIKDSCWAMQIKWLGMLMMIPTVFLAIVISFKTRKNQNEFLPNFAILFWITANSIWMCDEFYEIGIKKIAILFFILGLLVICYWGYISIKGIVEKK